MLKAAGACIIAKDTKRILLQQRSKEVSYPRNWGLFGGKIEEKENVSQGLFRELKEEINLDPIKDIVKVYPLDQYHSRDKTFSYYTFVIIVEKEFVPVLNSETGGYTWIHYDYVPKPLHPGTRRTFFSKNKLKQIRTIISEL
jgi:8-oxo-dGTP pyrophosphatase MutT (NUDIX family)